MSMIGNYRRLTAKELAELRADPDRVAAFLYDELSLETMHLDIDKTWQAIHFLLHGTEWEGSGPLYDAVLGGEPLGEQDVGYGPARFLGAEEVAATASALSKVPPDTLLARYDARTLNRASIYPTSWSSDAVELDYIRQHYTRLVEFFHSAAQASDAMLIYIN